MNYVLTVLATPYRCTPFGNRTLCKGYTNTKSLLASADHAMIYFVRQMEQQELNCMIFVVLTKVDLPNLIRMMSVVRGKEVDIHVED